MCGRYYIDDETAREIERLVRQVDQRLKTRRKKGDVYPEQTAAVIRAGGTDSLVAKPMYWGFPGYKSSRSIINARAETVLEKRMFRESALRRRCVVPAQGFYEWDLHKNKVAFTRKDAPVLFMAGLYTQYEEQERFVILTTEANASVKNVHNRMPLVLERSELADWVMDDRSAVMLLHKTPVLLDSYREYEQQSL